MAAFPIAVVENEQPEPREVLPASYFAPISKTIAPNGEAASATGTSSAGSKANTSQTTASPNILLSGEVVANETGGGPRLEPIGDEAGFGRLREEPDWARLAPVFETARMYTGAVPRLRLERVFGVTTFELG